MNPLLPQFPESLVQMLHSPDLSTLHGQVQTVAQALGRAITHFTPAKACSAVQCKAP